MAEVILGKVVLNGKIRLKTGLHIGSQTEGVEIGGIDNPVLKDPNTGEPYIPGSSLKGKMRSLFEKNIASEYPEDKRAPPREKVESSRDKAFPEYFLNKNIGTSNNPILVHVCNNYEEAKNCKICRLFGSSGDKNYPSRVIFRDAHLSHGQNLEEIVEIKYETAIDRITSAANPRPMERVVPGSEFDFEIVYNIENEKEKKEDLKNLINLMKMLEDDYLGGSGSRGYGKIEFRITRIAERSLDYYFEKGEERKVVSDEKGLRPEEVVKIIEEL